MMLEDDISATYYAVFDGHGGAECAQYLRENLHHDLKSKLLESLDLIKSAETEEERNLHF
jgi:serine/threonine protein phosphatase PrpC